MFRIAINKIQAVRMALFKSARLPPWRPGFDSRPGHAVMGPASLEWRWLWSNLFISGDLDVIWNTRTCKTRSDLYIPINETARPRFPFPHSCNCERLYIPTIGQPILLLQDRRNDRKNIYINRSQIHECRNWKRGCAVSFLGIMVSDFRYSVFAACVPLRRIHYFSLV
jgi:hypothetical protein